MFRVIDVLHGRRVVVDLRIYQRNLNDILTRQPLLMRAIVTVVIVVCRGRQTSMLQLQQVVLQQLKLVFVVLKVKEVHVVLHNLLCILVQKVFHFELGVVSANQRSNVREVRLRFISCLHVCYFVALLIDIVLLRAL